MIRGSHFFGAGKARKDGKVRSGKVALRMNGRGTRHDGRVAEQLRRQCGHRDHSRQKNRYVLTSEQVGKASRRPVRRTRHQGKVNRRHAVHGWWKGRRIGGRRAELPPEDGRGGGRARWSRSIFYRPEVVGAGDRGGGQPNGIGPCLDARHMGERMRHSAHD